MQADTIALDSLLVLTPPARQALPRWLSVIDSMVIAVLNVGLIIEVGLVFASTISRAFFNSSLLMGVDETAYLYLVVTAFMGGAVSYGRGEFVAITMLVEKMAPRFRNTAAAVVEWIIIAISFLFGGYAIPLLLSNLEEKTLLLDISYFWMTAPIMAGSALFVLHAGLALSRMRWVAVVAGMFVVVTFLLLAALTAQAAWVFTPWFYLALAVLFFVLIAIGLPIGFVLAAVGIVCVREIGSGSMVAVVMNAQRGTGGFIFLALPFFILAGFIMDRAEIGSRIVEFVAALIGHVRGGLMQVMIIGVYISSGISGSKAADMATIGIPMNKMLGDRGYPPHERAALLAAAAAMGESVPPSIAIIILGSVTSVSTGALFLAGFLPAATVGACLMLLVYIRARLEGWPASERASGREIFNTGRKAFLPLMMPVILVGGIVAGVGTPTEVSTFAVVYGLILGVFYRNINGRNFWQVLTDASLLNGMIFFTVAAATVFSWALTLEGMSSAIAVAMGKLSPHFFLPAVILLTVLMGAVLESFVTIIILGPILLPVAMQLGINPLQYGIILVESFGIGSILPPIGIALYVSCSICGAKVERATKPLIWYLAVMFLGLMLVASVPGITTVLPTLFNFKS